MRKKHQERELPWLPESTSTPPGPAKATFNLTLDEMYKIVSGLRSLASQLEHGDNGLPLSGCHEIKAREYVDLSRRFEVEYASLYYRERYKNVN